jgi:hypothetical protein
MADRPRPDGGDFGWNYELASGDEYPLASLRTGRVLALFCTQVLRLPHDNWAILTVVTSMSAQFVGSIAFKAIMRAVGTIVGALVGIWLVGD